MDFTGISSETLQIWLNHYQALTNQVYAELAYRECNDKPQDGWAQTWRDAKQFIKEYIGGDKDGI